MIKSVIVLGAGSAGLLAALSLKRKLPHLTVRVVRSLDLGVIGVGEGTTPTFPAHLFQFLGLNRRQFYEMAEPVWKLGIRFLWGPRERFDYTFTHHLNAQWNDLPRPTGYYCDEEYRGCDFVSACMAQDKVFGRQQMGGAPEIHEWHGYHIENRKLVDVLEKLSREAGVEFTDGKVSGAERGPQGIAAILLEDGRRLEGDLFVDASGFRSELLGRALEEPFISYDRSLFCDRAVVGGWERTNEPILPYTTAETMEAGWSWQIEHEHFVNRGYVFSSQAISDDQAVAEFQRRNPKVPASPRVVKFRSGRYRRMWVDNVVAVGNAGGFVEPLEATALMIICLECQALVSFLTHFAYQSTPTSRQLFNDKMNGLWDDVRDFLALHYRVNTRLDTPFWRHCREDTDVSNLERLLEFYRENGPSGFARELLQARETSFGIEGYLVMLVGNRVPYSAVHRATPAERQAWERHRARFAAQGAAAMDVREALAWVRHPNWRWNDEARPAAAPPVMTPAVQGMGPIGQIGLMGPMPGGMARAGG